MIRQNIKTEEYFKNYLNEYKSHIKRGFEMISNGKVLPERMVFFKKGQLDFIINYSIATYTSGLDITILREEYSKVLDYWPQGWSKNIANLIIEGEVYDQYVLSAYDEMLWMLSLGYLLDVGAGDFNKLVEVIDRDQVKDFLFEFIIGARIKDREPIELESYREYFGVPKVFEKLRQAITETEKEKVEKLVKEFVTREWYKNHKDAGWYNSHKSKHDSYFGYWSFETAAVVKIMGLDDSSFKDCQYYPGDLV
ncbi:PoNe immunity protein domain-containing protein [Dyadobacter diqingensis]|uniref:PoNe immunity protein domain-containing protein n=1 Tax=Dyadobacter diqingensis TaxID=2938121 RepID=UPI0020C1ACEC|nr:PoNe immunity protein domain-containing protein [Dyadobacter diqingensis]